MHKRKVTGQHNSHVTNSHVENYLTIHRISRLESSFKTLPVCPNSSTPLSPPTPSLTLTPEYSQNILVKSCCELTLWWLSGKESTCKLGGTREAGSIPGLGRSPGLENPIPVFFPGESHGQSSFAGYSPQGLKESDRTEWAQVYEHPGWLLITDADVESHIQVINPFHLRILIVKKLFIKPASVLHEHPKLPYGARQQTRDF